MLHYEVNFFPKRVIVFGSTTLFLRNPFLIVRISFFFSEKSSTRAAQISWATVNQ